MSKCIKKINSAHKQKCGRRLKCKDFRRCAPRRNVDCDDEVNSLIISAGPDQITNETVAELCCCKDPIHFFGECVEAVVERRVQGGGNVKISPTNLLDGMSGPTGPTGGGKLFVNIAGDCGGTSFYFDGDEWVHTDTNAMNVGGLECGALLVGGTCGNSKELKVGEIGQVLDITDGKPTYTNLSEGLSMTCGSLLVGDNNSEVEQLPTTNNTDHYLGQIGGKPAWKEISTSNTTYSCTATSTFYSGPFTVDTSSTLKITEIGEYVHVVLNNLDAPINSTGTITTPPATVPIPVEEFTTLLITTSQDSGDNIIRMPGQLIVKVDGSLEVTLNAEGDPFFPAGTDPSAGFLENSFSYSK